MIKISIQVININNFNLSAPLSIDLSLTNQCNLKCPFCSASPFLHTLKRDELQLNEIKKIFKEINEMGIFLLRYTGGEPLLRKDFPSIINLASEYDFDQILLTNGTKLNYITVKYIKKSKINSVAISIDGDKAELHDIHRGIPGTFKRVMKNLKNLRDQCVKYSAMTVVTSKNISRLTEITEFLEFNGFNSVNFILLSFSGNARKNLEFFPKYIEWEKDFLRLTNYICENNLKIKTRILPPHENELPMEIFLPLKKAKKLKLLRSVWGINSSPFKVKTCETSCAAGKYQMSIFENGDVFGCDIMRDNEVWKAGNIRSSSLKEIWTNSKIFKTLRSMKLNQLEYCGKCSSNLCGGGCRASAFNSNDSIYGKFSNCLITR